MQEKEYAVIALKDILVKALDAVETYAAATDVIGGWDLEFAEMSREEQADWLIALFEALVEHG